MVASHTSRSCLWGLFVLLLFVTGCSSLPGIVQLYPLPGQSESVLQALDAVKAPLHLAAESSAPAREAEAAPAQLPNWFKVPGVWASQQSTQWGTVYTQTALEYTGTYSQEVVWNDLMTWEVGTYVVGSGFIHFMIDRYEPTSYKGRPLDRPLSWTVYVTVVDQDTMEWQDGVLKTRWTMHRQN